MIVALLVGLSAAPAHSECVPTPLDDPQRTGLTGLDLEATYHQLLTDLYASGGATRTMTIGSTDYQVPPWYDSSTACETSNLKDHGGVTSSETDYVVNADELSELAVVTALGDDETRFEQIDNTVLTLAAGSAHGDLPCWVARANHTVPEIVCLETDSATDASVRIGLAYYYAAANPHFSSAGRSHYLTRARTIRDAHVMYEYDQPGCLVSDVSGEAVCTYVYGGGNAAASGSQMWIGYYQDVVLFLLAAYQDTGDSFYSGLAEEVVDQYLLASEHDPADLTIGRRDFTWDLSGSSPVPANPTSDPNYWPWDGNNAWDDADAPRALWIAHALTLGELTGVELLEEPYSSLAEWTGLMIDTGEHTASASCIQFGHDGTCVAVCGGAPKCNGLGYGALTYQQEGLLPDKLDAMLSQYDETENVWDGTCFGIYDGVRPVKALAAAVGFDSSAFGGVRSDACRQLDVLRDGSGSGYAVSSLAGIDCGTDCGESWVDGTSLTLTATPYAGSSFSGWSGAGCGGGTVQLDANITCTASFDGLCDDPLTLGAQTVSDEQDFAGCGEVEVESGFVIASTGDVDIRAGGRVAIASGFEVASGASLRIEAGAE